MTISLAPLAANSRSSSTSIWLEGSPARRSAKRSAISPCSRSSRSRTERDSDAESLRPCFTSSRNQLSMPRLRKPSENRYTVTSGSATSAPNTAAVRAVRRDPGSPRRRAATNCTTLRAISTESTSTATALASSTTGCSRWNCAEFSTDNDNATNAPTATSAASASSAIVRARFTAAGTTSTTPLRAASRRTRTSARAGCR